MKRITRVLIIISVCLLAGAAIYFGAGNSADNTSHLHDGSDLPRLLDLGSHTCTPCRMMVPELEAVSKEYTGVVNVEFIDVNKIPMQQSHMA